MVSKGINLGMRVFQFICTLLIMSFVGKFLSVSAKCIFRSLTMVSGNIIATSFAGNPSLINYDMFVAVFGMLSLFYLIPATLKESFQGHPLLMVALDTLNSLFFFCGAIAMAAELHVHSCSNSVCLQ